MKWYIQWINNLVDCEIDYSKGRDMNDYQDKINLLKEKINKLKQKEVLIIKKRKASFDDLVETLNRLHRFTT